MTKKYKVIHAKPYYFIEILYNNGKAECFGGYEKDQAIMLAGRHIAFGRYKCIETSPKLITIYKKTKDKIMPIFYYDINMTEKNNGKRKKKGEGNA